MADKLGKKPTFTQSVQTTAANKSKTQLENAWSNRPSFSSQYTNPLNQTVNKIQNYGDFSYDVGNDPLYNQYKDTYNNQGTRNAQSANATAAMNTGGFGNSYATTAGNLAYQDSLSALADKSADLAQTAYTRWNDGRTNLYNQANLLNTMQTTDYSRYRDTMSDLWNDLNYYQNEYQFNRSQDFDYYSQNLNKWLADRDYYYQKSLLGKK